MEVGSPLTVIGANGSDHVPIRKWWDAMQLHFVVLMEFSEQSMTFQLLSMPDELHLPSDDHVLTAGNPFTIRLPPSLLRDDKSAPIIPLLVKISLDHEILVIQFSQTLIRIVPVLARSTGTDHWTIDLSADTAPITSMPTSVVFKGFHLNLTRSASEMLNEGLYWSDHGGTSQDLIVVTTRAVLCYKVSIERNQMAPTHSLHQHQKSSNTRVWWEPETRCLVVGSKDWMRPYLFGSQQVASAKSSNAFPRLELPPPNKVPTFALHGDTKHVLLVNVYGKACLVELREKIIDFYFFDPQEDTRFQIMVLCEPFPIGPSDELVASVVDNVICLFIRQRPAFMLLVDTAQGGFNLVVPNNTITSGDKESAETHYLKPRHVLKKGFGQQFFTSFLNLKTIGRYYSDKSSMIAFLLRRVENSNVAHSQILRELNKLLDQQVTSTRRSLSEQGNISRYDWIEKVIDVYQQPTVELHRENKAFLLIIKCALLPPDAERQYTKKYEKQVEDVENTMPSNVLTQSQILEVLLEQAYKGLDNGNKTKLRLICDTAVEVMAALTRRSFRPCQALYCFVMALLWRLDHSQEFLAVARSIAEEDASIDSERYDVLGEMVLAMTTEVRLGNRGKENASTRNHNGKEEGMFNQSIINLSAIMSPSMLVKQLLRLGRVTAAIGLCTKFAQQLNRKDGGKKEGGLKLNSARLKLKVSGDEFFRAAIAYASKEDISIGERCLLFCYLHRFLLTWQPECLLSQENKASHLPFQFPKNKSAGNDASMDSLSKTCKEFPNHLFGGSHSKACRKVKSLFGYQGHSSPNIT